MTGRSISSLRRLEEERKERIFDAKTRLIGVDRDALAAQVEEKRRYQQMERDRDEFYAAQTTLMDSNVNFMVHQENVANSQKNRDVQHYRDVYQKRDATREWDINDPLGKRKDLPPRIGDSDPRCGSSSIQQFQGEDLDKRNRVRQQQRDMQEWIAQQIEEKQQRLHAQTIDEIKFAERADEMHQRAFQVEQEIAKRKEMEARMTQQLNQQMAQQRRSERMDDKKRETLADLEEIRNALDSDLLTENPQSTLHANDQYRYKRYHMKGLMPEHRQAIYNQQAHQREELRERKIKEAEDERQWALAGAKVNALHALHEQDMRKCKRQAVDQLNHEWRLQMAEQTQRKQQLNATYRNDIGDEFFKRFNTVTR